LFAIALLLKMDHCSSDLLRLHGGVPEGEFLDEQVTVAKADSVAFADVAATEALAQPSANRPARQRERQGLGEGLGG
jgi:hypothetical protein